MKTTAKKKVRPVLIASCEPGKDPVFNHSKNGPKKVKKAPGTLQTTIIQ